MIGHIELPNRCLATLKVNGEQCPVTNLFDIDGDETDDMTQAVSAVVQAPDGRWLVVAIDQESVWPLQ